MRQVVSIEPGCAPAWVELAHAAFGKMMLGLSSAQVMPAGLDAARPAVSADPHLAQAYAVLGLLKGAYQHDWAGALSEFRLALDLNAAVPSVHYWHALVLSAQGRIAEAIRALQQALDVDPFSTLANMHLCRLHTAQGNYDQAIVYGKQAVEVGPHHFPGVGRLGEAYVYSQKLELGIRLLQRSRSMATFEGWYTATLAAAYCLAGERAKAETVLWEMEQKRRHQDIRFAALAFTAAALGHADRAFEYLDRAVEDRDGILIFIATERSLDPIREDPRFAELLRRMNLDSRRTVRS